MKKSPQPLTHKKADANFKLLDTYKKSYDWKHEDEDDNFLGIARNLNVRVMKGDRELLDRKMEIIFVHHANYSFSRANTDWFSINIYWDFDDYNDWGLYGYYDTDYNKISIENFRTLVIAPGKKIKIYIELP